ncbi:very short patch repair endonuclease [Algiphilus sp.]|uniref:very short patch repair endonuclease n=1 Tax=Algiphilus sp. TaxID=1872431 RepID=UPI0032EB2289
MTDNVSKEKRSWIMSRVRGKDTTPELLIRRALFAEGYRYRIRDRRLPGRPDIVFTKKKKAIFVHGCYWHRHPGCPMARMPKSNTSFWEKKLNENVQRDIRRRSELESLGWAVLVVWECETRTPHEALRKVKSFLSEKNPGRRVTD